MSKTTSVMEISMLCIYAIYAFRRKSDGIKKKKTKKNEKTKKKPTSVSEPLDNLGHGGSFLTNSDVDTVKFLLFVLGIVETFLIDDGINGNGGFTVI